MNIIRQLFDEQYVKQLFQEKVLPLYPDFVDIKRIKISAPKEHIWEKTYHVVIEFKTVFVNRKNKLKTLPIYCSAHSEEPRENVFKVLKFLWESNYCSGYLTVPHPLFYSDYFKGTFYRGVKGNHLYKYIRDKKYDTIEDIIPKAAAWFAKLHNLPTDKAENFNVENSRIRTVIPGVDHLLARIKHDYQKYSRFFQNFFDLVIQKEEAFLASTNQRWLVHGDAHPENIIKMGRKKLAVIDFTDLCLADFARDIGAFTQQLEFMCNRKIKDPEYTEKLKKIFYDSYYINIKTNVDDEVLERIDYYYHWTAMRTATFFLLKDNPEPERAKPLIKMVSKKLNISL
ncbi:phosphotransferase [Patescibacteria group bacterium]